ncbi:hypothetical protein Rhow_000742 [Rhodococcus wratislaviensis]|uniref:Uncharacterized protein n=1 Tax=Rhodococcus wratislaviensis TaxID=44752 RepID=A0A402C2P7_RHOWR|nr:hypothetical protein Rhow_000742 [Rhodococcus wratislaviensis]
MFEKLHLEVLDRLGSAGELDWTAAILEAANVRAKKTSQGLGCQAAGLST